MRRSHGRGPVPDGLAWRGRLVVQDHLGDAALDQRPAGRGVRDLEGVEADAAHERDLVGQHVADGAQLAREAVLLAQQARGGEGAAVGELREASAISAKPRQVGGDVVDGLAGLEAQAERRGAAGERVALGKPALA